MNERGGYRIKTELLEGINETDRKSILTRWDWKEETY